MKLVADMGGTNTRLALVHDGAVRLETIQRFCNDDYPSAESVIDHYLTGYSDGVITECTIAIAGTVHNHLGQLTNRDWIINTQALTEKLGIKAAYLINDLQALGYALSQLNKDQLTPVHDVPEQDSNTQTLVVGIGTGFNVCPVLRSQDSLFCPQAEAGHISLPKSLAHALEQKDIDPKHFPTTESLLSGRGFSSYCQKMLKNQDIQGREILNDFGRTEIADTIINSYAELIGWVLRDLTLAYLPLGGIYCAGGMALQILARAAPECSAILAPDHAELGLRTPPVWFIKDDYAALYGCASFPSRP